MKKAPKIVLIAQFPLPYNKIGSWSSLYKNYLDQENPVDYLICQKPDYFFKTIKYQIVKNNFWTFLFSKIKSNSHQPYIDALKKIIKKDTFYIIQIIDNTGLLFALNYYFIKNGNRKQFYIQYFYHGFTPKIENPQRTLFYVTIDHLVVLTALAKREIEENQKDLRISFLHNGIDTSKFFKVSESQKNSLKTNLNLDNKTVFLWCSQDRPKKGLQIILDLWEKEYTKNNDLVLLIIGCEPRKIQISGVQFLGKIQNDLLPNYYQISDVYLFPTLCEEGFGMSLAEALHCGCYCIASSLGGVPEVLQYGKFGKLITNPFDLSSWKNAINEFLDKENLKYSFSNELYSKKTWNKEMNNLIEEAKLNFI